MRFRFTAFACATVLAMSAFVSCGSKKNSTSESDSSNSNSTPTATTKISEVDPESALEDGFKDVDSVEEGPLLKISETSAKAGETAEVTISVSNAELKWNMCGLHIVYPSELKCQMLSEETRTVRLSLGSASDYSSGKAAMYWKDNKTQYLIENNLDSIFFTEIFTDNAGLDGDIVTFYFIIPEDAESGTVYPIDFMFVESDVFSSSTGDKSFDKYAFEHWEGGSITVE